MGIENPSLSLSGITRETLVNFSRHQLRSVKQNFRIGLRLFFFLKKAWKSAAMSFQANES